MPGDPAPAPLQAAPEALALAPPAGHELVCATAPPAGHESAAPAATPSPATALPAAPLPAAAAVPVQPSSPVLPVQPVSLAAPPAATPAAPAAAPPPVLPEPPPAAAPVAPVLALPAPDAPAQYLPVPVPAPVPEEVPESPTTAPSSLEEELEWDPSGDLPYDSFALTPARPTPFKTPPFCVPKGEGTQAQGRGPARPAPWLALVCLGWGSGCACRSCGSRSAVACGSPSDASSPGLGPASNSSSVACESPCSGALSDGAFPGSGCPVACSGFPLVLAFAGAPSDSLLVPFVCPSACLLAPCVVPSCSCLPVACGPSGRCPSPALAPSGSPFIPRPFLSGLPCLLLVPLSLLSLLLVPLSCLRSLLVLLFLRSLCPLFLPSWSVCLRSLFCVKVLSWLLPLCLFCVSVLFLVTKISPSSFFLLQYMGKANLHVFEDWCGSSTQQLRKNPHYPLYPNSRITVKKLAVSPMWTNYGLRIFGYLHPRKSGEYLFAVASDDGSEFWLSLDSSPLNLHLQASVGRAGMDWTAPGEFNKYASQISFPVHLSAEDFYFFEVIHKQNDRGTDHLEVASALASPLAWTLTLVSVRVPCLALPDETDLKLHEVSHIPQTPASSFHWRTYARVSSHGAEMLREDPRDSFYHVPLMSASYLRGILPVCPYRPTYLIMGYPLQRYQGIHFVHLSYVYPNDYTRLTHMETINKCLYSEDPHYLKGLGFLNYMKMDSPENGGAEQRDNEQGRYTILLFALLWERSSSTAFQQPVVNTKQSEIQRAPVQPAMNNVFLMPHGLHVHRRLRRKNRLHPPKVVTQKEYKYKDSENYETTPPIIYDPVINWVRTINVSNMDFNAFREDSIDLKCNVSGNLQMSSEVALPIVQAFMHQLNQKNWGHFTLLQVVNVERRIDRFRGSRYLLELEVQDQRGTGFRISQYVYEPRSQIRSWNRVRQPDRKGTLLCYPEGVEWNPSATVHIIVPVKNQARWVQQFIMYMEDIYKVTGDKNFNIIIVDYSSKDMDVEQALQSAHIPRYQYVKLTGNFERSAALQAGINLITDSHSIAFLCDLHIHFPHSIIDSIRKHCVEGKITFAPIIMRLDCGATPEEPDGMQGCIFISNLLLFILRIESTITNVPDTQLVQRRPILLLFFNHHNSKSNKTECIRTFTLLSLPPTLIF
uniref:Beta-1,4-N-acetylgalactosaminyltransferase n=1 Tax=Paramormyrops kingsleyae TaxID=1676925 RepID=A0A3B3SD42_9TELE